MYGTEGLGHIMRSAFRLAFFAVLIAALAVIIVTSASSEDSDADVGENIQYQDLIYTVIKEDNDNGIYLAGLSKIPNSKTNDVDVQQSVVGKSGHSYKVVEVMDNACEVGKSFRTLRLPLTVTKIGNYAFMGCEKVETITGLSNVSEIGTYAFANCTLLKALTLTADIEEIKAGTFSKCYSLYSITLPNTVKKIGSYAFEDCIVMDKFTYPEELESLGDNVFSGCAVLKEAIMPDTVTQVGKNLYSGCTAMDKAYVSSQVTEITSSMFSGCSNLKTFTMSDGVNWIGQYAFSGCVKISKLILTNNVKFIGNFAFKDIIFHTMDDVQITDTSDLPGYTYVLRYNYQLDMDIMYRQETYLVHYDPNGGPSITDDEPHLAGHYFIPTRLESGALVCEEWIYDGVTYHYGDKIMMPGEDITLLCVWTHIQRTYDEDTESDDGHGTINSTVGLIAVGVALIVLLGIALFVIRRHQL